MPRAGSRKRSHGSRRSAKRASSRHNSKNGGKRRQSRKSSRKSGGKRKSNMPPVKPDALLAKAVGPSAAPRTQIMKKIWDYIKKHAKKAEFDQKKKQMYEGDALLTQLFGKKKFSMLEVAGMVSKHVTK